jgi:hypothetical protein
MFNALEIKLKKKPPNQKTSITYSLQCALSTCLGVPAIRFIFFQYIIQTTNFPIYFMLFGQRYHLYIFAVGANCQGTHRWIAGDRIRFTHTKMFKLEKKGSGECTDLSPHCDVIRSGGVCIISASHHWLIK